MKKRCILIVLAFMLLIPYCHGETSSGVWQAGGFSFDCSGFTNGRYGFSGAYLLNDGEIEIMLMFIPYADMGLDYSSLSNVSGIENDWCLAQYMLDYLSSNNYILNADGVRTEDIDPCLKPAATGYGKLDISYGYIFITGDGALIFEVTDYDHEIYEVRAYRDAMLGRLSYEGVCVVQTTADPAAPVSTPFSLSLKPLKNDIGGGYTLNVSDYEYCFESTGTTVWYSDCTSSAELSASPAHLM